MRKAITTAAAALYVCAAAATLACAAILFAADLRLWEYVRGTRQTPPSPNTDTQLLDRAWYAPDRSSADDRRAAGGRPRFMLLLVVKPNCDPCAAAVRRWTTFLRNVSSAKTTVSLSIASSESLDRRGYDLPPDLPVNALEIMDVDKFSSATGVRIVPTAILIERGRIVRAASGGIPSDRALHAFADVLDGTPQIATFTEHNTPALPINRTVSQTTAVR